MKYLFDSNPLIYFLNNQIPPSWDLLISLGIRDGAAYSVITRIEILGYPMAKDRFSEAMELLNAFTEIGLTEPIVQQTIMLRQQCRRLKLPDAIIAATAITFDLPLVTRNVADFHAIAGLQLLDPFV